MSAVETLLTNEKAIALRLIRAQTVPHAFWLWLSGANSVSMDSVAPWVDTGVLRSIVEIVEPNLADLDARERSRYAASEAWIAAILGFSEQRTTEFGLNCGNPMIVASLLPLYRSLATRKLPEALEQTRFRLAEMLVLVAITQELGYDFVQLLQLRGAPVISPYIILNTALKFDLTAAGFWSCQFASLFELASGDFNQSIPTLATTANCRLARREAAWSDPQLLWQIAGELTAHKAEIILPRQWADVAVPWSSISDHWLNLSHRLSHPSSRSSGRADWDCGRLAPQLNQIRTAGVSPAQLKSARNRKNKLALRRTAGVSPALPKPAQNQTT